LTDALTVLDAMENERVRRMGDAGIADGGDASADANADGAGPRKTTYTRAHGGGCQLSMTSAAPRAWLVLACGLAFVRITRARLRTRLALRALASSRACS
jgi:hypothetical protein